MLLSTCTAEGPLLPLPCDNSTRLQLQGDDDRIVMPLSCCACAGVCRTVLPDTWAQVLSNPAPEAAQPTTETGRWTPYLERENLDILGHLQPFCSLYSLTMCGSLLAAVEPYSSTLG
jgi:hypothetical protein